MSKPIPTKENSLSRLASVIPISSIVDVGVRDCTYELVKLFKDKKHHLFEPAEQFFPKIKDNYAGIDYTLYPFALSDQDSDIYLVANSLNKDGVATNSQITDVPVQVDGKKIVDCKKIAAKRFDSLEISRIIPENYLCKIDVDGKDLNVARGFGDTLKKASIVVMEATTFYLVERMNFLHQQGFRVIDLVDLVYYGPRLYQLDIVCLRRDLFNSDICPDIKDFNRNLWHMAI